MMESHKPDVAYAYDEESGESLPFCEICGRGLWFEYIPERREPDGIDGIFHHVTT